MTKIKKLQEVLFKRIKQIENEEFLNALIVIINSKYPIVNKPIIKKAVENFESVENGQVGEIRYKYKFWEWMFKLPRTEHAKLKKEFAEKSNVSIRTIANWFDTPIDSKNDIPAQALIYMAGRLGHTPAEAANYSTEVKSAKVESEERIKEVLRRSGLSLPKK